MNKIIEIDKKLFNFVTTGIISYKEIVTNSYIDYYYYSNIYQTTLFFRSQNNIYNYYMLDINL